MASFVSFNNNTVTIDGSVPGAQKTTFYDGEKAVQLRKARKEESGFNWSQREITQVVAKDVLIFDDTDMRCLLWFIHNNIKIDFSESYVSPDAMNNLSDYCEGLKASNISVITGSSIRIPLVNGLNGMGRMDRIKMALENIGFKVTIG